MKRTAALWGCMAYVLMAMTVAGETTPQIHWVEGYYPSPTLVAPARKELPTYRDETLSCPVVHFEKTGLGWDTGVVPGDAAVGDTVTLVWAGSIHAPAKVEYSLQLRGVELLRLGLTPGESGDSVWTGPGGTLRFRCYDTTEDGVRLGVMFLTLKVNGESVKPGAALRLGLYAEEPAEGACLSMAPYTDMLSDVFSQTLSFSAKEEARVGFVADEKHGVRMFLRLMPGQTYLTPYIVQYELEAQSVTHPEVTIACAGTMKTPPANREAPQKISDLNRFPVAGKYVVSYRVLTKTDVMHGRRTLVIPDGSAWGWPLADKEAAFRTSFLSSVDAAATAVEAQEHPRLLNNPGALRDIYRNKLRATAEQAEKSATDLARVLTAPDAQLDWGNASRALYLLPRLWLLTEKQIYQKQLSKIVALYCPKLPAVLTEQALASETRAVAMMQLFVRMAEAADVVFANDIHLTQKERLEVQQALQEVCARIPKAEWLKAAPADKAWGGTEAALFANTARCGLLLAGTVEGARELISPALAGLSKVLAIGAADGAWPEGPAGMLLALQDTCLLAYDLKRLSGGQADLFAHPYLKVAGKYALASLTPGREVWNLGETAARADMALSMAILAGETRNPHYQWASYLQQGSDRFDTFAYYDRALAPVVPQGVATNYLFEKMPLVMMRSGWETESLYVGLSGRPVRMPGGQEDVGSVYLAAYGQTLLGDAGGWMGMLGDAYDDVAGARWTYDNCTAWGHNTLVVDERGQLHTAQSRGIVTDYVFTLPFSWVVMDLTPAYADRVEKILRFVAFFPQENNAILLDVVRAGKKQRTVQWRFLIPPGADGGYEESRRGLVFKKGDARLLLSHAGFPALQNSRMLIDQRVNRHQMKTGTATSGFRSLGFGPITPVRDQLLITMLVPYKKNEAPLVPSLDAEMSNLFTAGKGVVTVHNNGKAYRLELDLNEAKMNIKLVK